MTPHHYDTCPPAAARLVLAAFLDGVGPGLLKLSTPQVAEFAQGVGIDDFGELRGAMGWLGKQFIAQAEALEGSPAVPGLRVVGEPPASSEHGDRKPRKNWSPELQMLATALFLLGLDLKAAVNLRPDHLHRVLESAGMSEDEMAKGWEELGAWIEGRRAALRRELDRRETAPKAQP